jgi:hypothetical protein
MSVAVANMQLHTWINFPRGARPLLADEAIQEIAAWQKKAST